MSTAFAWHVVEPAERLCGRLLASAVLDAVPLARLAFLAPRQEGGFPVNTAAAARVTPAMVGRITGSWCEAGRKVSLSRDELLALPQATHTLTLACVGAVDAADASGSRPCSRSCSSR